jgi:hypothetical protein
MNDFKNIFLSEDQLKNLKEGEEMFIQLMQRALSGESSKFEFIKC